MKEMLKVVSGFGFWVVWPWMPTSFYLSLCSLRRERFCEPRSHFEEVSSLVSLFQEL